MSSESNQGEGQDAPVIARLLRDGDDHLRKGSGTQADACFREILERQPDNPDALHRRGVIAFLRGDPGEASGLLRRAVSTRSEDPALCGHLANALMACGQLDEAVTYWQRALEYAPEYAAAYRRLGEAYFTKGDSEASETAYRKSLELAPNDPMGLALHWLGRLDEAEDAYRHALNIDPRYPLALKHLGVLLQERDKLDAAAECFEKLLEADPNDDVARHMLAATTGEITPSAPAGYVTRLFDDYADRFDAHLCTIDYQVPERIRDAVVEVAGNDQLAWRILDLGCGTGQCGETVKPLAAFLAGVDLYPRMIAKGRERNIYDSLIVGSIDDALEGQEPSFDLIIAGDTFIYVGHLSGVLAGCAHALRPGGLMAFSVESTDGDSYHLCPTGRYAHSVAHIDATAGASGMSVVYRRDIIIRKDPVPVPIPSQIVVLSKVA